VHVSVVRVFFSFVLTLHLYIYTYIFEVESNSTLQTGVIF